MHGPVGLQVHGPVSLEVHGPVGPEVGSGPWLVEYRRKMDASEATRAEGSTNEVDEALVTLGESGTVSDVDDVVRAYHLYQSKSRVRGSAQARDGDFGYAGWETEWPGWW